MLNERSARLAEALLADRKGVKTERDDVVACFGCGAGMVYRANRFCSDGCRAGYDLGIAGHGQDWLRPQIDFRFLDGRPMMKAGTGFKINCAKCGKEFESKGLRCCSVECERGYRDRQSNLAIMAEAGIEPSAKHQCPECGSRIPTWRNGRKVSSATRFCSAKCSRKSKKVLV
jgi:hypothetical protein